MPDARRSISTHAARRIDPSGLMGVWVNTESSPRGVAGVVIERRSDALGVRAQGVDDRTHDGWGWTVAEALYAASTSGDEAVAFTAVYPEESTPVTLHANVSKGLLIVSSFQTLFDSGTPDACFAREFFHRASSGYLEPPKVPSKRSAARRDPPSPSASRFAGTWRNTNSGRSSIESVSFDAGKDGSTMRILGGEATGLHDWGTTAVEIYNEVGTATEPAKIKARYNLGSIEVQLHGWVKQGVLVLALFRRFIDESGGSNYFDREFFFRANEP